MIVCLPNEQSFHILFKHPRFDAFSSAIQVYTANSSSMKTRFSLARAQLNFIQERFIAQLSNKSGNSMQLTPRLIRLPNGLRLTWSDSLVSIKSLS